MTWLPDRESRPWTERLMNNILKAGPIPHHIAFIMDGNRRFARQQNIDRSEGHLQGFERLAKTLRWCFDLGITEVTVYAFSIENFKRSKEEVDGLMNLAREKFRRLIFEQDKLKKYGVRVRVLGRLHMLPDDLQILLAYAMEITKDNNKAHLNVCVAYTSREEMCAAMQEAAQGVKLGLLKNTDISEHVLEQCLYSAESSAPDLLLRTSGEVRLSDFLLWQSSYSVLSFMPVLWPDFSVWHLYAGVIHYQTNYNAIQDALAVHNKESQERQNAEDYAIAQEELQTDGVNRHNVNIEQLILSRVQERQKRVHNFLDYVHNKRREHISRLASCYSENTCS